MKRNRGLPFLLASVLLFLLALMIALISPQEEVAFLATSTPTTTGTPTATPTATATATITDRPTFTATFTPTQTGTRLPTFTVTVTLTPTPTETPTVTLTSTPTATPVTPAPSNLSTVKDEEGTTITWNYHRISSLQYTDTGTVDRLSAFFSFRLEDRAIHRRTVDLPDDEDLTIYYLNTTHTFGQQTESVRLVIGGEWGSDVPISEIETPGSIFITALELAPGAVFNAGDVHRDTTNTDDNATLPSEYEEIFLEDLEARLASFPSSLIVLADHEIRIPTSDYEDMAYYFSVAPYLAARYSPFLTLDADGNVTGPSTWALSLTSYILTQVPVPGGPLDYASNVLVFMPGE